MTETQKKSIETLKNICVIIEETKEIGVATAGKLNLQTDQMERLSTDIDSTNSVLSRSLLVMKRMGKKVITDKVVGALSVLVVLAIGMVVYFKVYR